MTKSSQINQRLIVKRNQIDAHFRIIRNLLSVCSRQASNFDIKIYSCLQLSNKHAMIMTGRNRFILQCDEIHRMNRYHICAARIFVAQVTPRLVQETFTQPF